MATEVPTGALPGWLHRLTGPTRAPQKPPPLQGPLEVQRWSIPAELRNHKAWAVWRYEYENQRWSKPPYHPAGRKAEPSDPGTWSEFDECYEPYRTSGRPSELYGGRFYDGVSFGLSPRWGIVGFDLDHVSQWPAGASEIVRQLDSYTETTPGRDGIRIFVHGSLPPGRRRRGNVEAYDSRRFLSTTGHHLVHTPLDIRRRDRELYTVWDRWLNRG